MVGHGRSLARRVVKHVWFVVYTYMADWKIVYNKQFTYSPMTPWVHKRSGDAEDVKVSYEPPRPLPVPGKGYASFVIRIDSFPFTFASLHELDEAIHVLEQETLPMVAAPKKNLPVYRKLDPHGAQTKHWTSRLPKGMQGWAKRRKLAFELKQTRMAIKKALGPANTQRSYGQDPDAPPVDEPAKEQL